MKNNIIVQFLRGLLISLCVFWIISGIIFITRMDTSTFQYRVIMILMMLNGIFYALFTYLISIKARIIYFMLILFILVNAILTITDQVGVIDWVTLLINIIILVLSIFRTVLLFRKQ